MEPLPARNQLTAGKLTRLEDARINPLTKRAWPEGHNNLTMGRRQLPVRGHLQHLLDTYHQRQVFVLTSGTGSGKSTQIPQFLVYDEFRSNRKVACTQPRRIAATSVATRVAQEMGVNLGEEVGYQIGGKACINQNGRLTRLCYMTEGILLGHLAGDAELSDYSCVIIDEAHERTVESDMLLAFLKKVLKRRKDLKVIIMSATVDAELFQGFFDNCPLVPIEGRNFNVDVHFVQEKMNPCDFVFAAVNTVAEIHQEMGPGHVLVFMPGEREISQVCDKLNTVCPDLETFPLFGSLPGGQQNLALEASTKGRKCIVATNIAETSLTIDGVVYVVDSGLSRQMVYDPRLDMNMLDLRPISQASANQRKGRAGRTQDGQCFRLYGKSDYDRLPPSTEPAVRSSPMTAPLLRMLVMGVKKPLDFAWLEAPHLETFARARGDLQDLGFVDSNGLVTANGRIAAKCPLGPYWYRAIEVGQSLGCSQDILDIACICSSQKSIFKQSAALRDLGNKFRRTWASHPSDHILLANVFNAWLNAREHSKTDKTFSLSQGCGHYLLDMSALEEILNTRYEVGRFLRRDAKMEEAFRASVFDLKCVRQALAIAFASHVARFRQTEDRYRSVRTGATAMLAPHSCLIDKKCTWIVYDNLQLAGGKAYFNCATVIDPAWLIDLPQFQDDALRRDFNGKIAEPELKKALDAAKGNTAASSPN